MHQRGMESQRTETFFKNEICQPDDNPSIGIVLGARRDELLMEYALEGIDKEEDKNIILWR
jgi:hypothetical protein